MNTYRTQNLYEASYLLTNRYPFISKEHLGNKATLVFGDSEDLREAVRMFYSGNGEVSAKQFVENYRTIKDMVFER